MRNWVAQSSHSLGMRQNHAIDNATRVSASIGSDSDRRSNFFVRTHLAELVEALVDEHFSVHAHKFLQSIDDPILHALGSLSVIAMRAAEWFRDHIVHETVLKISLRSECETLRCNQNWFRAHWADEGDADWSSQRQDGARENRGELWLRAARGTTFESVAMMVWWQLLKL